MADVKISQLPAVSTIAPTDTLPIVSGGTTSKITGNALGYTDTGEFTTTTLVAGNVYISDNIITPLPDYDVYGNPVPQPLIFNTPNVSFTNANSVIQIGDHAGNALSELSSIAIGAYSGMKKQSTYAITIGVASGNLNQGVAAIAIGYAAGANNQAQNSIAIGDGTGSQSQGENGVAVGFATGQTSQGISAVAVGTYAGGTRQAADTVAIGTQAGQVDQGQYGVAVGYQAGAQTQGSGAVAVGYQASKATQGVNSVSVGYLSNASGINTVCIGTNSGQGPSAQAANAIVINATGVALQGNTSTFTVKPVRNGGTGGSLPSGFFQMAYNPTTGEIIYWS